MDSVRNEQLEDAVDKALAAVNLHCDTVQIFCTVHTSDEGTVAYQKGRGNWYARFGQVRAWADDQDSGEQIDEDE